MDDDIPAVLPQELPTGAAGWCQLLGTGDDRQSAKLLNAFRTALRSATRSAQTVRP